MEQTDRSHVVTAHFLRRVVALWVIVFLAAVSFASAADDGRAKRVLMIATGSRFSPGFGLYEQNFVDTRQD